MDRRRFPANERVAHESLSGQLEGVEFVPGHPLSVAVPVADLRRHSDGPRERQLLYGQTVNVLETLNGWSFVSSGPGDYVGYVSAGSLTQTDTATHWVKARATHLYSAPDFKAAERHSLSLGSSLTVIGASDRFLETRGGFVPKVHVWEVAKTYKDPVAVVELLLGTPYLWGGNSGFGIDCSGLVQIGCRACGIPCPGDSDMQQAELGVLLPDDAPMQRGDLLFWKGHVAWVAGPDSLIHANAFHMAVSYEPLHDAIQRIEAQGDGPVTARKRLGG